MAEFSQPQTRWRYLPQTPLFCIILRAYSLVPTENLIRYFDYFKTVIELGMGKSSKKKPKTKKERAEKRKKRKEKRLKK